VTPQISSFRFQKAGSLKARYKAIISLISDYDKTSFSETLTQLKKRASLINKENQVTGNSIIEIVDSLVKKSATLSLESLYECLQLFIDHQSSDPDVEADRGKVTLNDKVPFLSILTACQESI